MRSHPVPGDIDAAANPDVLALQHVIEKALQGVDPSGASGQAAVQPDGEHLWLIEPIRVPLPIKRVERRGEIVEELRARIEALGGGKAHIVGIEGVWDDEMRYYLPIAARADRHFGPIRQIVGVRIRVVYEA